MLSEVARVCWRVQLLQEKKGALATLRERINFLESARAQESPVPLAASVLETHPPKQSLKDTTRRNHQSRSGIPSPGVPSVAYSIPWESWAEAARAPRHRMGVSAKSGSCD
ncbi:hypothetical protein NDU88_007166 [Pleurodeles waltl]|uniref:Uncharacterized protein n=1 Tax=Pleurodeles waltl TaxID=8319 RepID=A0AAV7U2P6_PLEWA|nr:hypothetical protein NDU88_007166 [Pleurodeles waltl]